MNVEGRPTGSQGDKTGTSRPAHVTPDESTSGIRNDLPFLTFNEEKLLINYVFSSAESTYICYAS